MGKIIPELLASFKNINQSTMESLIQPSASTIGKSTENNAVIMRQFMDNNMTYVENRIIPLLNKSSENNMKVWSEGIMKLQECIANNVFQPIENIMINSSKLLLSIPRMLDVNHQKVMQYTMGEFGKLLQEYRIKDNVTDQITSLIKVNEKVINHEFTSVNMVLQNTLEKLDKRMEASEIKVQKKLRKVEKLQQNTVVAGKDNQGESTSQDNGKMLNLIQNCPLNAHALYQLMKFLKLHNTLNQGENAIGNEGNESDAEKVFEDLYIHNPDESKKEPEDSSSRQKKISNNSKRNPGNSRRKKGKKVHQAMMMNPHQTPKTTMRELNLTSTKMNYMKSSRRIIMP
jgi:hypothetical protein